MFIHSRTRRAAALLAGTFGATALTAAAPSHAVAIKRKPQSAVNTCKVVSLDNSTAKHSLTVKSQRISAEDEWETPTSSGRCARMRR